MSTTTLREDLADEFTWTTIETTRDDGGVILGRQIVYDNAVIRDEIYENGLLYITQQRDTGDVKNWDTLETYYDEEGRLIGRIEQRDSGIEITSVYVEGTINQRTWTDFNANGGSSDLKNWEQIDYYYTADGVINARVELRDNGVEIIDIYTQGVIAQKTWTDRDAGGFPRDVMVWDRIDEYYDETGQRLYRVEVLDDGVQTETAYEDGQRVSVISRDEGAEGGPSDARIWSRIETTYDESGQRDTRTELRDNGVRIFNEYEAGALAISTRTDTSEGGVAVNWDTITAYYTPDGQQQARETVYDNTDVTAYFYNEGTRELRLQYDGDDSASWLVRATLYDAAGQVSEVNTYDTIEDVPPEYGFWDWA